MAKGLALVTGASSGIGYNLAKVLAEQGYDLVIAGKEQDRTAKAESDFRALGVSVTSWAGDLSKYDEVMQLWRVTEGVGRPLDIACINAGLGAGGDFATETELAQELEIVGVNCAATVHVAKHVCRQMVGRGQGRILFTASIVSEMVAPKEAVYAASKAFVLSFARTLRFELKDTGVTVTALQPGPTDTDFFHVAGLDGTKIGTDGKKESDPYDVAKQGVEALLKGEDHVYSASLKTKIEGAVSGLMPDALVAKMHESMSEPAKK